MAKQFKLPDILPLHRYQINEESSLFNKYGNLEVGDTIDCLSLSGVIYKGEQRKMSNPTPIFKFKEQESTIQSREDISKCFSADARVSLGVKLGGQFGMDVSLEADFRRTFEAHQGQTLKLWTSDLSLNYESMSRQPKAPHTNATHYVKEKEKGGKMYIMSTSKKIEEMRTRFTNLSASAKAGYNGIGAQAKIKGQVQNRHLSSEDEGLWICSSTVGTFSYNDCTEESLEKKLQNMTVENLQPKQIILEPLSLPLVLSDKDGDSQHMQQRAKEYIDNIIKILDGLDELFKLNRDTELEDVEKMINELKVETRKSFEKILQDIKTLYHHESSPEKKMRASTRLSELDCEKAGSKLKKLKEEITNIVRRNFIPSHLRDKPPIGACDRHDYRVAIIGKSGSGKSSLANYIVGKDHFKVGFTSERVTTKFDNKIEQIGGKNVDVYDTPGFYDSKKGNDLAKEQTLLAQKHGQGSGFDAFLFVVTCGAGMEAKNVFQIIKKTHGKSIKNYTILVINRMKGNIDDVINDSAELKEISGEVGDRVIGVRCGNWKDLLPAERTHTCKTLLEMVQHISHAHNGIRFETGLMKLLKEKFTAVFK